MSASNATEYIDKDNQLIPTVDSLQAGGYTLMVKYHGQKAGEDADAREVDVSCDSDFMADSMPEVGAAIRAAYHWADCIETPIFLYLDNAGGHGTKEVVDAYINMLKDYYNIICVHQ